MGNKLQYNDQNPPPFHLNINNNNPQNQFSKYDYNQQNIINIPTPLNNTSKINNSFLPYKEKESFQLTENNIAQPNIIEEQEKKPKRKNENKLKNESVLYDFNLSIDIDIINNNKVNVKIPANKDILWQKEYNNNQLIGTIINDYIKENNLHFPDDYFNNLRCFKYRVSIEDKISTLLPIDEYSETNKMSQVNNIYKQSIDLSHLNDKYTEIMGKPFFGPFEILCFFKNERKFKILKYNNELIMKTKLNKFDISSAYCNGWNHLYISGGENCLSSFWDINLNKNVIHNPIEMPQKKYHSMIFIPKHIVFIIGGNSVDTFYYNLKMKKIINWGKLNIIRLEPALQIIKNKLYCLDSQNGNNDYTLEITDLSLNEGIWNLIKPKLSYNKIETPFIQQLFAICKYKDDNIIFLGGNFNDINKNSNMNFIYNISNNSLGLSNIKYKKFKLKEKAFCPFNNLYDYVLTDFPRDSPQMAFFNKKKGKIELINFSPDDISKKVEMGGGIENNKQNEINNKKYFDNCSNISPILPINETIKNQNLNNIHNIKEIRPKITDQNIIGLKNQNKNIINNIIPINNNKTLNSINNNINKTNYINNINNINNINKSNNINNINYLNNYIRKQTPNISNNNINSNITNYLYNYSNLINNSKNTVSLLSKTPSKYINNYQNSYAYNNIRTNTYSGHSFDSNPKKK